MKTRKELMEQSKKDWVEIRKGVFLIHKDKLQEYQKDWSQRDECKNIDFSLHNYWIQEDSNVPYPVHEDSHLSDLELYGFSVWDIGQNDNFFLWNFETLEQAIEFAVKEFHHLSVKQQQEHTFHIYEHAQGVYCPTSEILHEHAVAIFNKDNLVKEGINND